MWRLTGGGVVAFRKSYSVRREAPQNTPALPAHHRFTETIIRDIHGRKGHRYGVSQLLALVNRQHWIPKSRQLVGAVTSKCVKCQKTNNLPSQPKMATLADRTASVCPFQTTGIALAGPILTSAGKRRAPTKRWVCVFTCNATSATALDIVSDLSVEAFLRTFHRFTARHSLPDSIVTENGTNFVSAAKLIRVDLPNVKWTFNSPGASHFGGVHEIIVKLMKKTVLKSISYHRVTDEELIAILAETEKVLIARPLTYCSSDPDDPSPLTPSHFLAGKVGFTPQIQRQSLGASGKPFR